MSYFDELIPAARTLRDWADLRQEQGLNAAPDVKRAIRQMSLLTRRLERARPKKKTDAREPDSLTEILSLRPPGPRRLWERFRPQQYAQRVKGAWAARAAGCTLGAIVEGWSIDEMQRMAEFAGAEFPPTDYWPLAARPHALRYGTDPCAAYTRGNIRYVPVDDDLTYTLLGLLVLEDYGPDFTTAQLAKAWVKYLPRAATAERVTLENLRAGVSWRSAGLKNNPYMEWIGADIRADPWGYAAAGWPERAAQLAYRDARLSHRKNGIYGAMYFAATIAAAFAVDDPLEAGRIALTEIPKTSRLYADLKWALRFAPGVKDFRHARRLVDKRFGGMSPVHTNNNACLTIFALALGGRDVTKVIGNAVAMGMDNDCTAATAGSIVGAVAGLRAIGEHWYRPFRNTTRSYINGQEWFRNTEIARRFARVARKLWTV